MEAKKAVGRLKARPRIRDRVVAEIVETLMETAGAARPVVPDSESLGGAHRK